MKIAILQSNYIPWKGYFDIINDVDAFVFYDDVQFTKNDWRNRNLIKTKNGLQWLSVPCGQNIDRKINEVMLSDSSWQKKHWASIKQNYSKAPYFKKYFDFFEDLYCNKVWKNLSVLNQYLIECISKDILVIETKFFRVEDLDIKVNDKVEKLIEVCKKLKANTYLSGPAAKDYIDEEMFVKSGVCLEYKDYSNYPEYEQCFSGFEHGVSIIDLIFNLGPKASDYIWGWRNER